MDADKLEGLGSIGLWRTIICSQDNPIINPLNPFPNIRLQRGSETSSKTTVAQSILYTIEWFSMLSLPTSLRLGLERVQTQIGFLEGLVKEYGLSGDLLEQNLIIQEARKTMLRV